MTFLFEDRKSKLPRRWSNQELRRLAPLFTGEVVNVSAWQDQDKEGGTYRDYFRNARSYALTNYEKDARGLQGLPGEIFLDLEKPLPEELRGRFDVVFNHTVLEHVFEVRTAFRNLCLLTRDVVVLVVPFLQPMHGHYGDYWRFTPLTLKRLFEEEGLGLLYSSFNSHRGAAVYLFAVASRQPEKWRGKIGNAFTYEESRPAADDYPAFVGAHALPNTIYAWSLPLRKMWRRLARIVHEAVRPSE
jgi:hypothetical protein